MKHFGRNRADNQTAQRSETSGSHYDQISVYLTCNPDDCFADGTELRASVESYVRITTEPNRLPKYFC